MLAQNFVECLEQAFKKHWEYPAFSDYEGRRLRYGQAAEQIAWLHAIFRKLHLKKGDKIALAGRNSVNWGVTYLAAITYGAVIVPILPDFNADNIQHIVNHSDAVLLFIADAMYEQLDETQMPHLDAIFSLTNFALLHSRKKQTAQIVQETGVPSGSENTATFSPSSFSCEQVGNDELATIVYTSGTTGFSKGVMLDHNSLLANILFAQKNMPLKCGDAIVSFLPLAHAYGCAFDFLFPVTLGCHITFLGKPPSPKIILQAFQEVKPRLILSVPLVIEKIYQKKIKPTLNKPLVRWLMKIEWAKNLLLKKIRQSLVDAFGGNFYEIVIGGAALNEEVENFLKKIEFPFTIGYGMTECGPLIGYSAWNVHRSHSVGRAINYLELTINSPDPCTIVGNILVRGENVMRGYYKNEETTKEVLDNQGWLDTGDLGLRDQDGFIYIKGRSKNMLLGPSGQNIYPEELEAQINNLPYVQESVVLEKEGKLYALVYPDLELVDAKGLNELQVKEKMEKNRKALNKSLPVYSAISQIELYPKEFEKTPTRKIKRFLYKI